MDVSRIEVEGIAGVRYRNIGRLGSASIACLIVCVPTGCQGTFPRPFQGISPEATAAQRRDAERFDPYPDTSVGPSESLRPRDGQVERSEPRRIREKSVRSQGMFPSYSPNGMAPAPTNMPSEYQVVPP